MFAAGMVIALDNATGIRMFRERTDGIMLWTILLVLLVLWLLGLIGGIGGNLVHLLLVVALVVLVIQLITGRRAVI
jgi:fatty acid desaturase